MLLKCAFSLSLSLSSVFKLKKKTFNEKHLNVMVSRDTHAVENTAQDRSEMPLKKNVISKSSVFRHENTKKLAQLVKFTYIATVEIIQIDCGVNYRVNYTITRETGREVHPGRHREREESMQSMAERSKGREKVGSEWHRLER